MNWIFPMCGRGTRTSELGDFKPFIKIKGKKILEWLMVSIKRNIKDGDVMFFITRTCFNKNYKVEIEIKKILNGLNISNEFKIILTDSLPPGPAASVYLAKNYIDDAPVIVVNADQYIDFDMCPNIKEGTGFLPIYAEFTSKCSYVSLNKEGIIDMIVEKENISNLASAGVYCIGNGNDLMKAIEIAFEKKDMRNGEYYVGPALNNLIKMGYKFYPSAVRSKYDLGNIKGIGLFESMEEI